MKTCIIGNSHAGSLLKAVEALPEGNRPDWDFFVVPNGYRNKAGLKAINHDAARGAFVDFPYHRSVPDTGADVVIADYDVFVLVGAHHSVTSIAGMLKQEMSARFRAAALGEICRATRLYRFAETIRATSSARILLITRPAPTEPIRATPADISLTGAEIARFWATLDVELLGQPPATMTPEGLTRVDCLKGDGDQHFTPQASALAVGTLREALAAPRTLRSSG